MTQARYNHIFSLNEKDEQRYQLAKTKVKKEIEILRAGILFLLGENPLEKK